MAFIPLLADEVPAASHQNPDLSLPLFRIGNVNYFT
jgi:hypothetical protein